jgi:hypothetical protein
MMPIVRTPPVRTALLPWNAAIALLLSVSVGVSVSACGARASVVRDRSAVQCPNSQSTCLSAPECAWDDARACELCRCSPPAAPPDYTPQGSPRLQ